MLPGPLMHYRTQYGSRSKQNAVIDPFGAVGRSSTGRFGAALILIAERPLSLPGTVLMIAANQPHTFGRPYASQSHPHHRPHLLRPDLRIRHGTADVPPAGG